MGGQWGKIEGAVKNEHSFFHIPFLRSKIDEVFGIKMIQTVRGVGYVIKSE